MTLMMEVIASEQFHTIMETWQPAMGMEISNDKMHELRLAATKVKLDTQDIHLHHFEEDAKPELPRPELEARYAGDPELKEMEDLENKSNKFAIEGEDDTLIDLAVQWLSMFNQATMKIIMKKMIKEEDQDTITLKREEVADLGSRKDDEDDEGIIHLENDDGRMISPETAALVKEFVRRSKEAEKKKEEEEKDPVLPPSEHVNQHLERKEKEAEDKHGSSLQKEEPAAPASSSQREEASAKKKGPEKPSEPKPKLFYGADISGCQENSILRTLKDCFPDTQWDQWCGFYNRGYAQSEHHKHMFWHTQYRRQDIEFNEIHEESWHRADEEDLMAEYIARFKDVDVESELEELRTSIAFDCADPRLAPRIRAQVERLTEKAEKKLQNGWEIMDDAMADYIKQYNKLPYCCILQSMAMSVLGAGAVADDEKDPEYPYRSGKTLSCMFLNLGHWCRQRFSKYPLPTQLEKYQSYVDVNIDLKHEKVDLADRPVFNNYFVTVIKNLGAHIFLNCEASSIYPFKEEFMYGGWTYCFNDYHDLLCMARVGRHGYVQRIAGYDTEEDDTRERYVSWAIFEIKVGQTVDRATHKEEELTHARLHMVRACVYHVNQKRIDKSAGICGEAIATMVWECMKYQVDIIAGDGNKACYYPTPAKPCVPTYENSLIQFWIDRLVGCATQERRRRFQSDAAPVRVKHVITASFTDLMFLKDKLFRITTDNYTEKLAHETDKGDCCMMSKVEWGHARLVLE
eukprot:s1070_g2.t1